MLEGKRILVVDGDIPSICPPFDTLHDCGVVVTLARSAEDALQCLEEKEFDLLVTEVRLPQMNGYDFCKLLWQSERLARIPIVAASVNPFVNSLNIARCRNVVDFLPKPFTAEEMIRTLKRVFSGEPGRFDCLTRRDG